MDERGVSTGVLDVVAGVLLRCFLLSVLVMLLWFWFMVFGGDFVYRVHSFFFSMTRQQFDLVHYCGLAGLKIGAFVLFLIPYISIRQLRKDLSSPKSTESSGE